MAYVVVRLSVAGTPTLGVPAAGVWLFRRHAAPVWRLGLTAIVIALILKMVIRGLDFVIAGMGEAALEADGIRAEE